MLTVLLPRLAAVEDIDVSFSYRRSVRYEEGMRARLGEPCEMYPLDLRETADIEERWRARLPGPWWKPVRAVLLALLRVLPVKQCFQLADVMILTRLFRGLGPDIVHINNGGFPGAASANAAVAAARRAGVPAVVYVANNLAYGYESPLRWADYPLDRLVARRVTRFVTGSEAAAAELAEVLRLPPGKATAMPNGILIRPADEDPSQTRARLEIEPDAFLLAVVGRLERRKGHRVLLDALAELRANAGLGNAAVVIEGDGPERPSLQGAVSRLGLGGCVYFAGVEPNIWNLLHAADALVLPSLAREDFPNVTLEAMSLGKPVIASAIAGIPEQIADGLTGLLVQPGDAAALASAVEGLISDPEGARAMGEAGRRRFESAFTPEAATARYLDLYQDLCSEPEELSQASDSL